MSSINNTEMVRIGNDIYLDISRGLAIDKEMFHRFGHTEVVPSGSFADIWSYGVTDATYNWPTTTEKFRIKAGGNVNDTAAGTGARAVSFLFLDSVGDRVIEEIATAGASASTSTTVTGRRFLRPFVTDVGTQFGKNIGQILIENEASGLIVAAIEIGEGQSEMSQYTIPRGYVGYIENIRPTVSAGTNKDGTVKIYQRPGAYDTSAPFQCSRLIKKWNNLVGADPIEYKGKPRIEPLTDIWVEARGNGGTIAVGIDYDITLVLQD